MYSLGVDLGTTFVAAALTRATRTEMVTLGDRSVSVPAVAHLREDGTLLTGDAAQRRAFGAPDRTAREFKRRLGDPTPVRLGGATWAATDLLGAQLRDVLAKVTETEGRAPEQVVLTHPANWGPYRRGLFEEVPLLAGLAEPPTITEPAAAAAHYAGSRALEDGQTVAVYDLGGGTFDATVLRSVDGTVEIVGTPEGIERLGGIDFDDAVLARVNHLSSGALDELDLGDPATAASLARLRHDCVMAKEALSVDTETVLPVFLPHRHFDVTLTRGDFEDMIRAPIESTIGALDRTLRSARVDPGELSAVLLVGGSSRIPLVAQMVSAEIGRPVLVDTHPKYAVALGAARLAGAAASGSSRPLLSAASSSAASSAPAASSVGSSAPSSDAGGPTPGLGRPTTAPPAPSTDPDDPDAPTGPIPGLRPPATGGFRGNGAGSRGSAGPGPGGRGSGGHGPGGDGRGGTDRPAPPPGPPPAPSRGPAGRRRLLVIAAAVVTVVVVAALAWLVLGSPGGGSSGGEVAEQNPGPPVAPPSRIAAAVPIPSLGTAIASGPTPEFAATSPTGRLVYVANANAGTVSVIDTSANATIATVRIPAGPPQYVAFSPDGARVYVSVFDDARTVHAVAVLDTTTNRIVATIPVRTRPFLPAVSRDGTRLWVPNHDSGTVSVIDTTTNAVITEIHVAPNPHWVAFSADGTRAYTADHESNLVSVIDTRTFAVLAQVPVGASPHSLVVHPTRPLVAVVNYDGNSVSMIDTTTNAVTTTVPVGANPQNVVWSADGRFAYVADNTANAVSVIDASTMTVTATLPTPQGPSSITVTPDGRTGYVTCTDAGVVLPLHLAN